jgi:hypothetical protein
VRGAGTRPVGEVLVAKPTLEEIKRREQQAESAAARAPAVLPSNTIPGARDPSNKTQLIQEMAAFQKDLVAVNKPGVAERVDAGELPEVTKEEIRKGQYRYSNTPFDNEKVREKIESRCKPMDFGDLIVRGRVTQLVEIMPRKLSVTFESLRAADSWWLTVEAKNVEPEWLANSWSSFAQLALSTAEINGHALPRVVDDKGNISRAQFDERYNRIMELPDTLVSVLLVNLNWFMDRVQAIMNEDFEQLKNG